LKFVMELKIDDLMDWLWEALRLPELKPKRNPATEENELVREGWDKRGARSRLDRRRTVKEAVKRRAIQTSPAPFTDDDLRFRQIVARQKPAIKAAIIFALDVSGSMGDTERQLAKTFFFNSFKPKFFLLKRKFSLSYPKNSSMIFSGRTLSSFLRLQCCGLTLRLLNLQCFGQITATRQNISCFRRTNIQIT
ncbi:MAG: DUF444 family protein, partial [Betaproteobacteria bacterium]|nr:DUF444 family protein [Betaproteobacteria bacterium]